MQGKIMSRTIRGVQTGRSLVLAALIAGTALGASAAQAKDYLLAMTKPSRLHLIDLETREVVKYIDIPSQPGSGPLTVVPSPDGKRAYVMVDRWESISGIDLDSGKEVFRADLSSAEERVKNMFALEISRDGKELYVFESPVKLGLGEYQVQDTRIAVYDTAGGMNAPPVRTFKAPRQILMLMMSPDGQHLYGLGRDLFVFEPKTGNIVNTIKLQNWSRTDVGPPDIITIWPQYEQTNIFTTPYIVEVKGDAASGGGALKAGQMVFDLASQSLEFKEIEDVKVVLFGSVVNPEHRNEIFIAATT
jgi:quinohemoprotein amine dehydrogenase beta subunit